MTFPERIVRFIRRLDTREFYQFIGGVLAVTLLLVGFFMYRYYHAAYDVQRRMIHLNKQIAQTQKVLEEYSKVRAQKNKVDELIARNVAFRIQPFFIEALQAAGIGKNMSKDPTITRHDLVEGYIEIRLEANLSGLSMQQLVTLLQKLEENERVYVRALRIIATPAHLLDVMLGIATFEATVSVA
jgi:predicted transcriptional regulator